MKVLSVKEIYTSLRNAKAYAGKNTVLSETTNLLGADVKKAFAKKNSASRVMESLGFDEHELLTLENRTIYHPKSEEFGVMQSSYLKDGRLHERVLPDGRIIQVDYSETPPILRKYNTTEFCIEQLTEIQKGQPKCYLTRMDDTVYELQTFHHLQNFTIGSIEMTYRLPKGETLFASKGEFEFIAPQTNIMTMKDGRSYILELNPESEPVLIYKKTPFAKEKVYQGFDAVKARLNKMSELLRDELLTNFEGIFK